VYVPLTDTLLPDADIREQLPKLYKNPAVLFWFDALAQAPHCCPQWETGIFISALCCRQAGYYANFCESGTHPIHQRKEATIKNIYNFTIIKCCLLHPQKFT